MGLFKHLLFWPVTGPLALVDFSVKQIERATQGERTDDGPVKEELMALQTALELGDVDEDEYLQREAELMRRLRDIRALRTELGLEEEWAPLAFPPGPDAGSATPPEPADDIGGRERWSPDSSDPHPPDSSSS